MTEWRDIPGYEGFYKVSEDGQIKSLERIDTRGRRVRERILKQTFDGHGYLGATLARHSFNKRFFIHRLVMLAFVGDPPADRYFVNHIDGVRTNNQLSNLEYCSQLENVRHAKHTLGVVYGGMRGRDQKGEANNGAKLTAGQVSDIRSRFKNGESANRLALAFGVHPNTIYRVLNGTRWAHVA